MPKKICQECGEMSRLYSDKFDSYFCAACDKWLENKCSDGGCDFCATRPEKPSEVRG